MFVLNQCRSDDTQILEWIDALNCPDTKRYAHPSHRPIPLGQHTHSAHAHTLSPIVCLCVRCVDCERAFLAKLDGNCRTPIAGQARVEPDGRLKFRGLIASPDGKRIINVDKEGPAQDAINIGKQVRCAHTTRMDRGREGGRAAVAGTSIHVLCWLGMVCRRVRSCVRGAARSS